MTEDAAAGTRDAVLAACDGDGALTLTFNRPEQGVVIADHVLDDQDSTYGEAPARSYDHVDRFIGSVDLRQGVASFVERRPPRFAPLGPFPD